MLLSKEIFSWGEEKESKLDREALMKCDVFFFLSSSNRCADEFEEEFVEIH